MKRKHVALVPAYNEEESIEEVITHLKNHTHIDVVVIDDGSTDSTPELVKKMGVVLLRHNTNRGKGEAIRTGFDYVLKKHKGAKYVVLIDADMQYSPKDAARLLRPLGEGKADVVTGYRNWKNVPLANRTGNFVWRTLFNMLFGTDFKDTNCGYMAFTKDAVSKIRNVHGGYIIENSIFADCVKNNLRVVQVPVEIRYGKRKIGKFARMFFGVLWFIIAEGVKYRVGKLSGK